MADQPLVQTCPVCGHIEEGTDASYRIRHHRYLEHGQEVCFDCGQSSPDSETAMTHRLACPVGLAKWERVHAQLRAEAAAKLSEKPQAHLPLGGGFYS